ncbi:MAG: molybdopterin-dependent oxidoreductase [Rhodospirillales bacterium]|nr:molybdopterin-dependent oxidoreductase [Rhodospirillales bacterium]
MITELPSVCPMDCPDTCSLLVTVEDDKVIKVRGSHANPFTKGVLCNKVSRDYPEFVHGENRLTEPLRRIGKKGEGRFQAISWQQAFDAIFENFSANIEAHGPQSIVPLNYAGPHGMLSDSSMDGRFFHKMGATLLNRGALCGGVKSEAYKSLFGGMPTMPPEQAVHSKLIVVWGNNVTVSNLHFAGIVKDARKAGAKLVVIDPKRVKIAETADMHLAITPGTDVVLAWAIAQELERLGGIDQAFVEKWTVGFEAYMKAARQITVDEAADICGIAATQIRAFARLYLDSNPAVINIGNGMERNRNGGSGNRAAMVLPVLAGKFGVRGGGLIGKAGNAFPTTPNRRKGIDLIPAGTRTFNIIDVAKHILDDTLEIPVKAVFIYNHNPVSVHPDQNRMKRALAKEDVFVVGCDVAMTDSMSYCDIVLPASTHFEFADVYGAYGQQFLQRAEPVIPRVGNSLPNTEIFRRLAARFGYTDPQFCKTDAELMDESLDLSDPRLQGYRPSQLPLDRAIPMEFDGDQAIPFVNTFPTTTTGKVELLSDDLGQRFDQALPSFRELKSTYPLYLITPSSDKRINATFGGLKASDAVPVLEMHPADAAARGLKEGATVKVWNDLGDVHLSLKITDAVRPGTIYSPKGAWFRTSDTGQTVSALVSGDIYADLIGGACYNDTRVEVAAKAA